MKLPNQKAEKLQPVVVNKFLSFKLRSFTSDTPIKLGTTKVYKHIKTMQSFKCGKEQQQQQQQQQQLK